MGKNLNIPVYTEEGSDPIQICQASVKAARENSCDVLILDTAGRLHIDEEMMQELAQLRKLLNPSEVLLVVDAMTGQDAVQVAEEFHSKVGISGLIQ